MVLIFYEREGTVLLLDVLAQLRKVKARVCTAKEDAIVLSGLVGDLQNPENISFKNASGPRTIDSSGLVEDWVLEEEMENTLENENFETISVSTDATDPLEMEEGEESFFQYNAGEEADDVENQQDVESVTDVESRQDVEDGETLDWDAPDYVPTWLASLPSPLPKRKTRISTERYLRRSKRLQERKRREPTDPNSSITVVFGELINWV
jgi:hypothetical protein